jgi:hypothetical protein
VACTIIENKTTTGAAAPFSPYSYVQQPHLEDKTMLQKFSWKHFPRYVELFTSFEVIFVVLAVLILRFFVLSAVGTILD